MNQVQADASTKSSICQKVIEAVADAERTDATDLVPPLYDAIDPDALESLFDNDGARGKVVFNYMTYEVSVFSDGYVSVNSLATVPTVLKE
ncbi:HalOD1 output domain-containing protein [Halorubellus sp. JP-L1]|uniref:HalOD1 output domain-containing protein n=1 Tax=Halorubellus sp. JP-L1 TaxID=2715753 RepID=UPI0034E94E76